jgi:hypothetical protein
MNNKRFGALSSSMDPQKLGTTVQAVMLGASGLIVFLAAQMGIKLVPADMQALAANSAILATQVSIAFSALGVVYGLARKLIVKIAERRD